jgi:anti-anti-sigma regulatory factor
MLAVKSMDSSALGMMLLLREYVGGDQSKIIIKDCPHPIKTLFLVSNFDQLFTIV